MYLQAFITSRDNINKLLRDPCTAADSLPKDTSCAVDNVVSSPFQGPSIIVESKDTAIRDVVLYITHFRTLFRLYNRLMAKQKRQDAKAKFTQALTTITKSGRLRLLSDNDLHMDVDSDSKMTRIRTKPTRICYEIYWPHTRRTRPDLHRLRGLDDDSTLPRPYPVQAQL